MMCGPCSAIRAAIADAGGLVSGCIRETCIPGKTCSSTENKGINRVWSGACSAMRAAIADAGGAGLELHQGDLHPQKGLQQY